MNSLTREEAFNRFHIALSLASRAPRTVKNYDRWLSRFFDFLDTDDYFHISIYDAQDFLLLVDEQDYAARTFNVAVYALRTYFDAVLNISTTDRALPTKRPKSEPKPMLTTEQVLTLIHECKDLRLAAVMTLAFTSGLRVGEIVKLRFRDFHKSSHTISIINSKNDKSRYVQLADSAALALRRYCIATHRLHPHPDSYVFLNEKKSGQPLKPIALTQSFYQYIQTFPFYLPGHSIHCLRHNFATQLALENTPLPVIQRQMGHTSAATTAEYIHLPEDFEYQIPDILALKEKKE